MCVGGGGEGGGRRRRRVVCHVEDTHPHRGGCLPFTVTTYDEARGAGCAGGPVHPNTPSDIDLPKGGEGVVGRNGAAAAAAAFEGAAAAAAAMSCCCAVPVAPGV